MLKYLVILSLLVGAPAFAEMSYQEKAEAYKRLATIALAREILEDPEFLGSNIGVYRSNDGNRPNYIEIFCPKDRKFIIQSMLDFEEEELLKSINGG